MWWVRGCQKVHLACWFQRGLQIFKSCAWCSNKCLYRGGGEGGESCQAGLCHVSCMNLLQHNEKPAVALHLIQFHPSTVPPFLSFPPSRGDHFERPSSLHKRGDSFTRWCHLNRHRKPPPQFIRKCVAAHTWTRSEKIKHLRQTLHLLFFFFGMGVFSNKASSSSSSKWCVYSKLNISCWLIALTATHLLLLLSHRSWHEENSVIEKSRAWSLFAHIWQMGHHRFKGEHLETGGRGRRGWGWGGGRGWGWLWK